MPNHKVLAGGFDKTGTALMKEVFRRAAKNLDLKFYIPHLKTEHTIGIVQDWDMAYVHRSQFVAVADDHPWRAVVCIRDPRDVIISAAHYHCKASEKWLHVPLEKFSGRTYQQAISGLPSDEERFLFEMEEATERTIRAMLAFEHPPENITVTRLELLVKDKKLEEFRRIFDFLGFTGTEMKGCLKAARNTILFGRTEQLERQFESEEASQEFQVHTRSGGRPAQWRGAFTPRVMAAFVEQFGDAAERLGYPPSDMPISATDPTLLALVADARATLLDQLAAGDKAGALQTAMDAAATVLPTPNNELRLALRRDLFMELPLEVGIYQRQDFEIVDYGMYEMVEGQSWLRGPRVSAEDLAGGNYFTVVGAAQFFGRGVEKNIAKILTERLGIPCLNLSFNGAGVNTFTAVPEFIDLINGGMFSIVQTMSGRSIGVPGEPESFLVVDYLDDLYRTNPSQVEREINRFNRIYLDDYAKLASAITVPAAMLFTSIRAPEDWSPAIGAATGKWGKFPQLVGADLHAEVATMFEASFEVLEAPPDRVSYSRFTGEPAPRFGEGPHGRIPDRFDPCELKKGFDYYPGAAAHVQMADAVEEWIRGILAQRFNMIM